MQQVSKYADKESPYISLVVSKLQDNPNVTEMRVNVHSRFMSSSDITHSRFSESKLECSQKDQVKESQDSLHYISNNQCKNCLKWKNWAVKQQKGMLQLQKQLIFKEQKLFEVMGKQKLDIMTKSKRIEELQLIIQKQNQQIDRFSQQIELVKAKCEQLQNLKIICETPKKYIKDVENVSLQIDLKNLELIKLSSLQNTDKIRNVGKTSAITTKAQGWQCSQTMKKEIVEKSINFSKANELEKIAFENQTLKDYNSVLLERLRASKYKKVIC